MNRRKSLIISALVIMMLTLAMIPLAAMLNTRPINRVDEKQQAVLEALEAFEVYEAAVVKVDVQVGMEIEDVWALEDAREEAQTPLVSAMYLGDSVLGYDAESQTFYCTLGMGHADAWPEIALSAHGAPKLNVAWVDDYTFDSCSDAIAQGYRYELFAYTPEQFGYIGVVFTGMPIVSVHAAEEIGNEDVPARFAVSGAGFEALSSAAVVHQRGGGYGKPVDKQSYRIELQGTKHSGKKGKIEKSVLGMPEDSDWLLLANASDETAVRGKLAWNVWSDWYPDDDGMMMMKSELVEVFVNDTYKGIYEVMQRVREADEVARAGGTAHAGAVVRMVAPMNESSRRIDNHRSTTGYMLEYRYEPQGDVERAFRLAEDYVLLSRKANAEPLDDETFAKLALERVDVKNMMEYILFNHVCALQDNTFNNLYVYIIRQEDGQYRYMHAPWDLDRAFWDRASVKFYKVPVKPDTSMQLPHRMLDLNVGNCREVLWSLWREKRATVISDDAMYRRFTDMEAYVNGSGAFRREMQTHYGHEEPLDLTLIMDKQWLCFTELESMMLERWPIGENPTIQ